MGYQFFHGFIIINKYGKLYLFNVYTFCKSPYMLLTWGLLIVYHRDPIYILYLYDHMWLVVLLCKGLHYLSFWIQQKLGHLTSVLLPAYVYAHIQAPYCTDYFLPNTHWIFSLQLMKRTHIGYFESYQVTSEVTQKFN